ncbi:helix-turn-helix domain-containing protein [Hymenobacter sp. DG25B]|uniref:helix-turn-helix domain-containing protein n=1 Tax=Hymenobacter sp. DG25B TaxID=1385664 RepID=UPI0012E07494|nr:helix-turn-helix transcriptional regulator [Hymenobacter sp. DG25B]
MCTDYTGYSTFVIKAVAIFLIMVERIKTLLATRQLTPTQFADAIGVGRPIISHILTGRNKPSLEVVQKILAAFPDLSVSWLLSGQGEMQGLGTSSNGDSELKTAQKTVVKEKPPKQQSARPSLFEPAQPDVGKIIVPEVAKNVVPEAAPQSTPALEAPSAQVTTLPLPVSPPTQDNASALLTGIAEPGKAIRRIVIFYQDGTFSAYQPE